MVDYCKRLFRFFALLLLIPLLIGLIDAWSDGFGFILFILGIPCALIALVVGGIVGLVRGARLPLYQSTKLKRALVVGASPLLAVATLALSLPVLRVGSYTGNLVRLLVNYSHYERVVAKAKHSRKPAWFEEDDGVTYSTDLGPPVRVAFNPAGMLDNWSGIIYDPTGDVMLARGFDGKTGKFYAPHRVTKLFSGDLMGCSHLWRFYYVCSFT